MVDKTELAFDFLQYTQENLFITGKAGTGKTTFLRRLIQESPKKMVVVAPTGVAAIQANGVTMHSLFQLPFGLYISSYKKKWGVDMDNNIINEHQLLSQLRINAAKRQLLQNVELIIVDEVSMVRADYMDAMDTVLRFVRRSSQPFGGCQMLFIGDMYQLPPVVQNHERLILMENYNSVYFFDAHVLKDKPPICIEFDKIYRQTDPTFIQLLNSVRNNAMDQDDFELLESRYFPHIDTADDGVITISSHNATVDAINAQALQALKSKSQIFKADVVGNFPDHAFPMPVELELKEGAQVMFTKNDKGENRRYYNGKIGKILRINRFDNQITIEFKNESDTITIEPEKWENIRYHYDEANDKINEEVIGTFQQFPLKLAWAVTIHKSQGMTFDEAIVDAGKSFAPGQVYVALSRLRTLDGLYLKSKITAQSVMVDPQIIDFFKENDSAHSLEPALKYGQLNYLSSELSKYFDFSGFEEELTAISQKYLTDSQAVEFSMNATRHSISHWINQLHKTGYKFIPYIHSKIDTQDWQGLQERYNNGIDWFNKTIEDNILSPIQSEIEVYKLKKNSTKMLQTFHQVKMLFKKWLTKMNRCRIVLDNLVAEGDIEIALRLLKDKSLLQEKDEDEAPSKTPSYLITINLFKKYKNIEKVIGERNIKESTAYSHFLKGIQEKVLSIHEVLSDDIYLKILDTIKKHPHETSVSFLKSKLDDSISFDMIRLVLAHIMVHKHEL